MAESKKGKLSKLWAEIKQGNWDYFFDALAFRLPVRIFSYFHFYMYEAADLDLRKSDCPDCWCRFGTIDDIEMLTEMKLKREVVESRFRRGDLVAMVGKEDKVLAVIWANTGNEDYPGPNAYFLFGGYTRPEARGQGLSSLIEKFLREHFSARGRQTIFGSIGALNKSSLRIHERMGFRRVGNAYYMIILGLVVVYFKSWPFDEGKIRFFLKKPPDNKKLWFLP